MATLVSPLTTLINAGVAIWLDDLSRERLSSGSLDELVRTSDVVGVTTNPTIFAKALSISDAYHDQLVKLSGSCASVDEAVFEITTEDVRRACDALKPVFDQTNGLDGCVSIEVDPRLAHDAEATVRQAEQLWAKVDRPNLFIKIPATEAGLLAISSTLAKGISVNVTLIFSLRQYRGVVNAFQTGLERAITAGFDLATIRSVASFFVSRVDTAVDALLDGIGTSEAAELRGTAAIANARLAYQVYLQQFSTARWDVLAGLGALPQRPLWASTGVKDTAYRDTRYVEELVAPGVVNTMPEATLRAVADHGHITGDTITGRMSEALMQLKRLDELGIDLNAITDELESNGVEKFIVSWDELLASVADGLARAAGNDSEAEAHR